MQSFGDIVELRPSAHAGITLVRPDGYIAYSSHNGDRSGAWESVRTVLERQTQPAGGKISGQARADRAYTY